MQLTCLRNCTKCEFSSFSLLKTKRNFPALTCSKKKKKKKRAYSIHPAGCCYLAVYDTQIEGGLTTWMRQPESWLVHSRGNHATLGAGCSSYFAVRFLLCDFERGLWMILNVCLAEASRPGREWPSWAGAENAKAGFAALELAWPLHAVFEVSKTEIKLLSYYAGGGSRRRDSIPAYLLWEMQRVTEQQCVWCEDPEDKCKFSSSHAIFYCCVIFFLAWNHAWPKCNHFTMRISSVESC